MTKLKRNKCHHNLSGFAQRTLLKLQSVAHGSITNDHQLKVGSMVVPSSVVDSLLALDLVIRREGKVWINAVGEAYIRRMKQLERAGSADDEAHVSAYVGQHMVQGSKDIRRDGRIKSYPVNVGETPLGWLLKRKGKDGKSLISMKQFLAGERLREDFELSGISPHVTLNYDAVIHQQGRRRSACDMTAADHTIAAKKRLDSALHAVGSGLGDVLVRVCCHLEGLEAAEKSMGWPARSGKVVLSIALSRLEQYYNNHIG